MHVFGASSRPPGVPSTGQSRVGLTNADAGRNRAATTDITISVLKQNIGHIRLGDHSHLAN